MKEIIKCEMCGKDMEKKGPRKYCSSCRKIRDKEVMKSYNERRNLNNKLNKDG